MRKIRIGTIVSPETFQPSITCKVVLENGQIINLLDRVPLEATEYKYKDKKFNESQFRMIEGVNVELTKNGMFEMTLEEAEYMVQWHETQGTMKANNETPDPDELTRLAGYKIEKTITYL